MKLNMKNSQLFVPDGLEVEAALKRTTHMAISAHQDDVEIMAVDGVLKCFQLAERWFTAVVATDGAGSPRDDLYRDYTDERMRAVRAKETKKAAVVGEYAALALLDYPSSAVKNSSDTRLVEDLVALLDAAQPEVVYTHNLADKHPTHVATAVRTVQAIRRLAAERRPKQLFGCEVWRGLEWIMDDEKVIFDVSGHENLQAALLGVYDSQIAGGKRYDLASTGRRRANATYFASHAVDTMTGMSVAMDLTPLIQDPQWDIREYVQSFIQRFAEDVNQLLRNAE